MSQRSHLIAGNDWIRSLVQQGQAHLNVIRHAHNAHHASCRSLRRPLPSIAADKAHHAIVHSHSNIRLRDRRIAAQFDLDIELDIHIRPHSSALLAPCPQLTFALAFEICASIALRSFSNARLSI